MPSLTSRLRIGDGVLRPDLDRGVLYRQIDDVEGRYVIPYLQADGDLTVKLTGAPGTTPVALTLSARGHAARRAVLPSGVGETTFSKLPPAEWRLVVERSPEVVTIDRVGVGTVIAALGDSITEGYLGRGYHCPPSELHAGLFPLLSVSRDGRNFPQHAPTTAVHKPEVNCFESWLTGLNDALTAAWRRPVFIANEGLGAHTTGQYLDMMRHNRGWQKRMQQLAPAWWLIHLGVNDERACVEPEVVGDNLAQMVRILVGDFGAQPKRILLARPCFDRWPGADEVLRSYLPVIEQVRRRLKLSAGPDFYGAYQADPDRWYGEDPVHPNEVGMGLMAQLWAESILQVERARR